jgi:hypothetical protein
LNLSSSTGETIQDPTAQQIQQVLTWLPPGDTAFAILGQSEQVYIHAYGCEENGFMLEYREGSDDRQFRATDYGLPLDTVVEAFRKYAAGDPSFAQGLEWEPSFEVPPSGDGEEELEDAEPEDGEAGEPADEEAPTPRNLPLSPGAQHLPDMSAAVHPSAGCLLVAVAILAVALAGGAGLLL